MSVVTGLTQAEFEKSIQYDKRMDYFLAKKAFYGGGVHKELFSCHYFKDGVEIGYWVFMIGHGFILPQPRIWHPNMFRHLEEFIPWKNPQQVQN